jgi:predicted TIM-barrel fold metal-dependent hydrolase
LKIIDSHLHVFREERVGVLAQGGEKSAGFSGTLEEVQSILDRERIGGVMAIAMVATELARRLEMMGWPPDLSSAERAERERELERKLLAAALRESQWICSATLEDQRVEPVVFAAPTLAGDAVAADIEDKIERYGVKAIKIHPALDFVLPTHPGYRLIFEIAQDRELVVISHGGDSEGGPYQADIDYCAPKNFAGVLDDFPKLRLVVAHVGYPYLQDFADTASTHPNLYTDLSFVLSREGVEMEPLLRAIRAVGFDRVLFGTDFPYFDPETCLDRLEALDLSADEMERITWRNPARLFGLSES